VKKLLLIFLSSVTFLGAQEYMQIADNAAKELLKTLGGNLKKHLKTQRAQNALVFCANNAYDLTQQVSKKVAKGVTIKRISLKPRNPANAPSAKEAKILQTMQSAYEKNHKPQSVRIDKKDRVIVYKPLIIKKKACLICHGDVAQKRPQLYKKIKEIYPNDQAVGYKMNDFRGAIVVTITK